MIQFTDKRLYLKGTCASYLIDPATGNMKYYTNKGQTGNLQTSVTMGEIRAGLGNSIAAIIPSDSALNVEFNAADFSLFAKAANAGSAINYNAVVPVCEVVTASSAALTLTMAAGTPVAFYGSTSIQCYVQTVGAASAIGTDGVAYALDATSGVVSDFTAVSGTQYKVWYYTNKASAKVAAISSVIDPAIYTYVQQMAVYANESAAANEGTRVGWLYAVVPYLKLGGNASLTGDRSNADTTSISGQAVAYDDETVSATCSNCAAGSLAYYIYAPDDSSEDITGLAVVGGTVSLVKSTTKQIPVRFVMGGSQLVAPNPYTQCSYAIQGTATSTVSTSGVITAGASAEDFDVLVKYPATGTEQFRCTVAVSVTAS